TPFYPYSRQDKKHRGREPISARLISDLFERAGADRIMSVDLHTAQIQGFFDGPVDHLFALPLLADYVQEKYATAKFTVVSPAARWRSSTRPGTRSSPTRSSRTGWSGRWPGAAASWSTT